MKWTQYADDVDALKIEWETKATLPICQQWMKINLFPKQLCVENVMICIEPRDIISDEVDAFTVGRPNLVEGKVEVKQAAL